MRRLFAAALLALAPFAATAGPPLGDDGLHKPDWVRETFKDLREDLAEATAEGRRMLILVEQRGCIYCKRMHEEIFPQPAIDALIREDYFVVQVNLVGAVEVTDFDGETMTEKAAARHWGVALTPTLIFLPATAPEGTTAAEAAAAVLPGALDAETTEALLRWIVARGYESGETFADHMAMR